MIGMLTAANKYFRSIGRNFTNFYRLASSVDSVSQEIYSQQAFCMPYTCNMQFTSKKNPKWKKKIKKIFMEKGQAAQ
jgi:hypothetical protein